MLASRCGLAASLGALLLCGCASMRGTKVAPPQEVDMDPQILAKFKEEVEEYVELHQELLKRVPNVTPQSTAGGDRGPSQEDDGGHPGRADRARSRAPSSSPRWPRPSRS